jgi:hypothetical protein
MIKECKSDKVVRYYWGLTWPTLITGAIVVLTIVLSSLWLINIAMRLPSGD